MTRPRKEQVCIEDTPYYHSVSRCVRRALLCGTDQSTGKSYEHRRDWIENRIRLLSSIFGIDILSYAVMSNHLHIVVKLCPAEIDTLSNEEVAQRWTCLFRGPRLIQHWLKGDTLDKLQLQTVNELIDSFRNKLQDLGWFMKCLNEPIARQANKEDECTGHFWEGRYNSQALLSEQALLSCMAYVDLNPIRAGMAKTPETSDHTSIKERINPQFNLPEAIKEQIELDALLKFDLPAKPLLHFEESVSHSNQTGILFSFRDYLELVDLTGRVVREEKKGFIPTQLPPILQRLQIDLPEWLSNSTQFESHYQSKFSRRKIWRERAA